MSSVSRWANIAILPLVVLLEFAGWHATKSIAPLHLMDIGYDRTETAELMSMVYIAQFLGILVAGAAAFFLRPTLVLAQGALIAATGLWGLYAGLTEYVFYSVLSFGIGMIRPAFWGAASRALGAGLDHARTAFFFGLFITVNVGGLIGPLLMDSLREPGVTDSFFEASGLTLTMGAFLSCSLAWLMHRHREADERPQTKSPPVSAHLIAVGLLLTTTALIMGFSQVAYVYLFRAMNTIFDNDSNTFSTAEIIYGSISFITIMVVGIFAGIVFLILQLTKRRFPSFIVPGVGAIFLAIGCALGLFVDPNNPTSSAFIGGFVLLSLGEILLLPSLYAQLVRNLPHRLKTAVFSFYFLTLYVPSLISSQFADAEPFQRLLGWVCVGLGLFTGLTFIAGSKRLTRIFEAAERPKSTAFMSATNRELIMKARDHDTQLVEYPEESRE